MPVRIAPALAASTAPPATAISAATTSQPRHRYRSFQAATRSTAPIWQCKQIPDTAKAQKSV